MSLDWLGQKCPVLSLRLARRLPKKRLRRKKFGQRALQRVLSRLFLRFCCSLFYIVVFSYYQWLNFCLFTGDVETIPGVSGNEDVSTGVETNRQLRGRHIVVTRRLVPLAGGPSMMSLRVSKVEFRAGSRWSGPLMLVIFVFKWGID